MRDIMWTGKMAGKTVRVVRVSEDDCIVEELLVLGTDGEVIPPIPDELSRQFSLEADGVWAASDDGVASAAYMTALLFADSILCEVEALAGTGAAYLPVRSWRKLPASDETAPPAPRDEDRMDPHVASVLRQAVKTVGIKKIRLFLDRESKKT